MSKNYSDLKPFQYLVQNSLIASSVTRDSNILFSDLYKCGGGLDYSKKGNMVGEKNKKISKIKSICLSAQVLTTWSRVKTPFLGVMTAIINGDGNKNIIED